MQINAELIGNRLRLLRESLNKSVAEMSMETGIGETALRNYENGYRVPKDEIKVLLAQYFGRGVEELFYAP